MARTPSKYDSLDASRELEQEISRDLTAAFAPRGCTVIHNGSLTAPAAGGKADIEVRDSANKRLMLVEVTKETGHASGREFPAVTGHLESAIKSGGGVSKTIACSMSPLPLPHG
jgi:hypothetical protein